MNFSFWKSLGKGQRISLVAGVLILAAGLATAAAWLLRSDYQVLFADLSPQDAAAMVTELEQQKVPFKLEERTPGGGTTILVDQGEVYRTRLKVMGRDIPLHGAVGFELFNNSDFGMTEFAQRVNYQRALQGELTRTILSLTEIRDARVLLALPEQGLFKPAASKAKASITLSLKPGLGLAAEQVAGIQRLVAAAVPAIAVEDVTIVDQRGVALTRVAESGGGSGASGRLDLKRDAEDYLSRKATLVLEQALGAGQALASVDVTLDLQRVQVTTDDVLTHAGRAAAKPTGVVVRERETVREHGSSLTQRISSDGETLSAGGTTQREVEYAVGRRVEQVISQPGSIQRLHVVAVVKRALDPRLQEQVERLVAATVGLSQDRGDTVVVQSIGALESVEAPDPAQTGAAPAARVGSVGSVAPEGLMGATLPAGPGRPLVLTTAVAVLALLALLGLGWRRAAARGRGAAAPPLTEAEREAALRQVTAWLRGDPAGASKGEP